VSGTTDRNRVFQTLRLLVVFVCILLTVRVVQIQVFAHDHYGQIAQVVWGKTVPLHPARGTLLDRSGNPLALSVTTWDVGVATSLMSDAAATAALVGEVLGVPNRELQQRLAQAKGRFLRLDQKVVLSRVQKRALDRDRSVTLDPVVTRVYPHDGVGASLVGFFRYGAGDTVATGLEYSLDSHLAGQPGVARLIKTPVGGRDLGHIVQQEPVAGQDVALTVDIALQGICEQQLAASIERCGAQGGSVLILDPRNGDILAAASWPLVPTRGGSHPDGAVWNNRNFISQYEPGSVFKVFSMASLLGNSAIDTATVFDCSDPVFEGYTIDNENHHRYGNLNLMRAFTKSSNIYFARAVGNLSDQEFYRDLVAFGFGQPTNLPYRGTVSGTLREPSQWSRRSKSTLAIGQEIAVTPLQLGLGLCAVANGGTLYAPRLVRAITDPGSERIEAGPPLALRRVMAPELAELLRVALGRVVKEGTGVDAKLDWITTGGKTGTAQVSLDGRTFARGAYMASFGGVVPLDDPRLVILTILDRPHGIYHFASQSAAPLFRDIIQEIRNETAWLTDVPGSRTAVVEAPSPRQQVEVPDVLFLGVAAAAQRLGARGFALAGAEREGLVVQQVPAPGTLCAPGATVELTVGPRQPQQMAEKSFCPDFHGLSDRQVRGLAGRLGIRVDLQGNGYATGQDVNPGEPLRGRAVRVTMEKVWP